MKKSALFIFFFVYNIQEHMFLYLYLKTYT